MVGIFFISRPESDVEVIVVLQPLAIAVRAYALYAEELSPSEAGPPPGDRHRARRKGIPAVTFDMRGAGRASLFGSLEIQDVIAVCKWVSDTLSPRGIVLVGSSAGAPIAGSAVDKIDQVVGYVSIGYPFGLMASVLFGRHHEAILKSKKPKLFIMGTKDGFTSVKQLQNKLKSAAGKVDIHLIEGVGHFQMEGPAFDTQMVGFISTFGQSLQG
ncbi:hypothetical protein BHM03_00033805 [Ensete ventricosum]|nr:hypothetical protein BHM03_00033805 [Ensete ventricosum]